MPQRWSSLLGLLAGRRRARSRQARTPLFSPGLPSSPYYGVLCTYWTAGGGVLRQPARSSTAGSSGHHRRSPNGATSRSVWAAREPGVQSTGAAARPSGLVIAAGRAPCKPCSRHWARAGLVAAGTRCFQVFAHADRGRASCRIVLRIPRRPILVWLVTASPEHHAGRPPFLLQMSP